MVPIFCMQKPLFSYVQGINRVIKFLLSQFFFAVNSEICKSQIKAIAVHIF